MPASDARHGSPLRPAGRTGRLASAIRDWFRSGMFDVIVIGGGAVGAAIAYGCARLGAVVAMLDGGDDAFRAARANAGLIWSQHKGLGSPAYAAWTRRCVELWPAFAEEMNSVAGKDIGFSTGGGVTFCLSDEEMENQARSIELAHAQPGGPSTPISLLDGRELRELLKSSPLGPAVCGGTYTPSDSQVNPLQLLRALHAGFLHYGGHHFPGRTVSAIEQDDDGYRVVSAAGTEKARRVVIAAGLDTTRLAAMLGINVPVVPTRGQVIITERVEPILPIGASGIRQHLEGTLQIGVTVERGVNDRNVAMGDLARMAARVLKIFPAIRNIRAVRTWAGVRPVTPDGLPAYASVKTSPGVLAVLCHSAVTLASGNAGAVARSIMADDPLPCLNDFGAERFGV